MMDGRRPERTRPCPQSGHGPRGRSECRGRACFEYAQKLALTNGWQFNWRKVEVPGIAHDGKAMLASQEVQQAMFGAEMNSGSAGQ